MDVQSNPKQPHSKPPKDGFGPRGAPDCYYTSRVLNSTGRYVRFVKKMREDEETRRISTADKVKKANDQHVFDFFAKCDRGNLIKKIDYRVGLCLKSYEDNIMEKRKKLMELLTGEEEQNIRAFVIQTQAGIENAYQKKMERLKYLLAKRQKEHEDRYTAIPLEKCTHVQPCLVKLRAKEAGEVQLYQIREKQMRKMAEAELDRMWYEVTMKEADALGVRMEIDEIARAKRAKEQAHQTRLQQEQIRECRERERERLKREVAEMKAQIAEDDRKEEEKQRKLKEKLEGVIKEREEMLQDRKDTVEKMKANEKLIQDAWESLTGQGLADQVADLNRRRRMQRELNTCNSRMIAMKNRYHEFMSNCDPLIREEGQQRQDARDLVRCQTLKELKRQKVENQKFILKQIHEKKADIVESIKAKERAEYDSQVQKQMDELIKHKVITDRQAQKLHQKDLTDQIEYNKLLKERAKQDELDQIKKYELARAEYQDTIKEMVSRPFHSDHLHPFMSQMAKGVKPRWCPCAADLCVPPPEAKKILENKPNTSKK